MTRIKDLVEIKSGYARFVNLVQTFRDPTENRARMEQYMPITSHRQAFENISRALRAKDGRVYLLTGSYGTGKSHLCLMLANYLSLKPTDPEMVAFFRNWARRDASGAEKLQTLRGEGRYLVALGEYGIGDDFDSMVLRAIARACEREEIGEAWLDTEYHEAIRQIDRWEAQSQSGAPTSAVFRAFQDELGHLYPEWTLEALKDALRQYSQEARRIFKELYRAVVGNDFAYSKDNLVDILTDFLAGAAFRQRYVGLAIIADEFGDILGKGAIRVSTFMRFAEMCAQEVGGSRLIFVGTAHRPFHAYSGGGLSTADFQVAAARVVEVPLESEGLEDIVAAIVIPDKTHPVWQAEVASRAGMFNRFALLGSRAGIFPHLKGPALRERIIENIYPMHPMATYCVIQLSREVSSNARSVFTFFSGAFNAGDGSYPWYVAETDVTTDDRLNLYTVDLLTTYFRSELRPESTEAREEVRQHIRNYRASLHEVQKRAAATLDGSVDPLVQRTLDVMLVYEICGVANTAENLAFGLYCESDEERTRLENRLAALVKEKTLFRAASGVYEFRRSEATPFETMIEDYMSNPDNQPADLAQEVMDIVPLGKQELWLEARNYNLPYQEDKRLRRVFARPGDLEAAYDHEGGKVDFFTYHELAMLSTTEWRDRYEGIAVYVLCETEEETQRARRRVEENKSRYVVVGIPRQAIPIREAVMYLRAVLHIQKTEDLDAMSLQDRSRLQQDLIGDEQKGYKGAFTKLREQYLGGKALTWYAAEGRVLVAQPNNAYEPADELARVLFSERTPLPHPFLNPLHVTKFGPGKDAPLTDAIDALLHLHRPIEIDHSAAADRGEIRFLKKCLADCGALVQTGPYHGSIAEYRVETNPGKFRAKLPALASMIDELRKLAQGKKLLVRDWIAAYARDPYGQGPVALSLYLAYVFRAFGDELRLQLQPGAVGWVTAQSADLIYRLVDGQHPNASLERQPISDSLRAFINGLYNLFASEPGAVGQTHSVNEAFSAVRNWWTGLPNLAQSTDIYPTEDYATARALVQLLTQIDTYNAYAFVLEDIQSTYGYDPQQALTTESQDKLLQVLKRDKQAIESAPQRVKEALLPRLMKPFAPQTDLYGDYQAAIETWYRDLDDGQRDPYSGWHSNQSQAIVQQLKAITDIAASFFERLPAHAGFGLGRVDDWHSDRSADYLRMFHDGLEHIEANRTRVPAPKWQVQGATVEGQTAKGRAKIDYRGEVRLVVEAPEPGVVVFLTETNADPRDSQTQRQQVKDTYELGITHSGEIRMVCEGTDGSYGQVVTLSFVNEDHKYEVHPVTQRPLPGMDEEFKFVFPPDRQGLRVTVRSLLETAKARGAIEQEVRAWLKKLAEEL